ncbi:hypothetical protein KCP70_04760 [Salmonella enterica subsp. enterica]|nr:hypothetical protein KCP70_04760 [Salmonella enterica subsp. enterica]
MYLCCGTVPIRNCRSAQLATRRQQPGRTAVPSTAVSGQITIHRHCPVLAAGSDRGRLSLLAL